MSGLRCDVAIERFQEALDRRARPFDRSLRLSAHFADCPRCRERGAELERMDRAARRLCLARPRPGRRAGKGKRTSVMAAGAAAVLLLGFASAAWDMGRGALLAHMSVRPAPLSQDEMIRRLERRAEILSWRAL